MKWQTYAALAVASLAIAYSVDRCSDCVTQCQSCETEGVVPKASAEENVFTKASKVHNPNDYKGFYETPDYVYSTPDASLSDDPITVIIHRNGGNNTDNPWTFVEANVEGVKVTFVPSQTTIEAVIAQAAHPLQYYFPTSMLRLFNGLGRVEADLSGLVDGASYYLVRKDNFFFWPGVRVGHKVVLEGYQPHADGSPMVMETISMRPRAFFIDKYLSDQQIADIFEAAGEDFVPSLVFGGENPTFGGGVSDEGRTSTQKWLYPNEDPVVPPLRAALSDLVHVPETLTEPGFQVVHYAQGQQYTAHHDYFPPEDHPEVEELQRGRNRMITTFFYLNDVHDGGETAFPKGGPDGYGEEPVLNLADCSRGIRVKPRRGGLLIFYNFFADGHMRGAQDDYSLHLGCEVRGGEKTAANYWWYNQPLGPSWNYPWQP